MRIGKAVVLILVKEKIGKAVVLILVKEKNCS
jgi:hypothetical protein